MITGCSAEAAGWMTSNEGNVSRIVRDGMIGVAGRLAAGIDPLLPKDPKRARIGSD
jgi:hypothetical protein